MLKLNKSERSLTNITVNVDSRYVTAETTVVYNGDSLYEIHLLACGKLGIDPDTVQSMQVTYKADW